MLNAQLSQLARWTRGHLVGENGSIAGVSTDTRRLQAGALFVALATDSADGHDFVEAACRAGAGGAMVTRAMPSSLPQIVVEDTWCALGDMARSVRADMSAQVIGITGSNGKTTVKQLCAAILSQAGLTHATEGNFNNEIGLPLTLFSAPAATEFAVLEMGAGKPGDIAWLADIAKPDVALVNTVAPAHLERMGSLEEIAHTKGAIYAALPREGIAIINADDDFADYFVSCAGNHRCVHFSMHATKPADVRALAVSCCADSSHFQLETPQGRAEVSLPLPGKHNVANALAATAIAVALGISLPMIVAGLSQVKNVDGRLARHTMAAGWTLIDDSYNANPASVAAAIDLLACTSGETWLVLGDMAELGSDARNLHAQVGEKARQAGIDRLLTVGDLAQEISQAFGNKKDHFEQQSELLRVLGRDLHAGITCLIKGSHSSQMEKIVLALQQQENHHVV